MSLSSEHKQLVANSWKKLDPIAEQAAAMFYQRLFELNPEARKLFKVDIKTQGQRLMEMIGGAVSNLDNLETVLPEIKASGVRHKAYGVKPEDYDTVAAALLWTLEKGLGEDFNDDTRTAWVEVYTIVAQAMQDAAEHQE